MMSRSSETAPRGVRPSRVLVGFVLAAGLLIVFGSDVSPWILLLGAVGAVATLDCLVLRAFARRTSPERAWHVGLTGTAAFFVQAGGIYFTLILMDDWSTSSGSGWLFWVFPVASLVTSVALMALRAYRAHGLAVLIGSVEGFFAVIAFFVAAFTACNCWD